MSFYPAIIGQCLITTIFVFSIWGKVFANALKNKASTLQHQKLILLCSGLVVISFSIAAIMVVRLLELKLDVLHTEWIAGLYVLLAIGNFLAMLSASIGNSWRQIFVFAGVSLGWVAFCLFS